MAVWLLNNLIVLTSLFVRYKFVFVAQSDRALVSEAEGRGFESPRTRFFVHAVKKRLIFFNKWGKKGKKYFFQVLKQLVI